MPRAKGHDLCEIFGYAPDDTSEVARKQWKSQECPFVGGVCIKHSHPQEEGRMVVYGSCSVANKTRKGLEEVILCPQRLYADDYAALKTSIKDATGEDFQIYMADHYGKLKRSKKLPDKYAVLIGKNSGREVSLSNPGVINLSLDWVVAIISSGKLQLIIPCEVQSIDTTGNYHENWRAYAEEKKSIPDSRHGMNWANVWKRLIPQLILKGSIAATSNLCSKGLYFVIPDRVFVQFEKLVGEVANVKQAAHGVLTIMTYGLGGNVPFGKIRNLERRRIVRILSTDFAKAFALGKQLPLGTQLDEKILEILEAL